MPACARCKLPSVEPGADGTLVCGVCGFVVEGLVLDASQQYDADGAREGQRTDGRGPQHQKPGQYDREVVREKNRREARRELHTVAATLHMEQHEQTMQGYLERVVDGEWGQGRWVRNWCAAVAYIVARTRPEPVALSLSAVAAASSVELRELHTVCRTVVGLLRLRHVLGAAGVSKEGTDHLLHELDPHSVGELFSLKAGQLATLGVPQADIAKVLAASAATSAAAPTRFPLPDEVFDPRVLIDGQVKRLVPPSWFRENPVMGNRTVRTARRCRLRAPLSRGLWARAQVVEVRKASFWLLTLAAKASLGTGRKPEPLCAAAVILAAESARLRAPGRQLALGALPGRGRSPIDRSPAVAVCCSLGARA